MIVDPPHLVALLTGAAGLCAVYSRLRREFSTAVSVLSTVLIAGATSLSWAMLHADSAIDVIAFGVTAVLALLAYDVASPRLRLALWIVLTFLPIALGSLAGDRFGHAVAIEELLFSSSRGMLSLTPVVYIAALGLVLYVRRNRTFAVTSIAVLVVWLAARLLMPAHDARPFDHGLTAALALLAPGLAHGIDAARRRPLVTAVPLVAIAALWNYWLMVQYTAGLLPKDEPVSFATMVRQQADVHTRSPYVYPFAFPANVLFAWREGLPADRFEVLSREPWEPHFEVVMDHAADRFLLDGWGGAGSTPAGVVRWTAGRRVSLAFPLKPPSTALAVTLVAAARVEEPAVAADLSIELNGREIGRLVASPTPETATVIVPAADVGQILREGYNRLIIVSHGVRRIDPADQRPLGPLAGRSAEVPYPVAIYRIRVAPAS